MNLEPVRNSRERGGAAAEPLCRLWRKGQVVARVYMAAAWASGFATNVMAADTTMGWLGDGDLAITPNSRPTLHVHTEPKERPSEPPPGDDHPRE